MWHSVCGAAQGRAHIQHHLPCQDKVLALDAHGVQVISLADGAGSARLSHFGADCAVRTIAHYLADHFTECFECADGREVKRLLLDALLNALQEEARSRDCELRDLASTLLVAAVHGERFILAHLGDGVLGYLDGEELKVASAPDNGEFSNETVFITSPAALTSLRLFKGELKNKCAFVLMSDGTEQTLYHKQRRVLSPAVKKLMHLTCLTAPEALKARLQEALTHVISTSTTDDCSLAVLARSSPYLLPLKELNKKERRELYFMNAQDRRAAGRLERYDEILEYATTPRTLREIAKEIHLRPQYTRKHVERLATMGFIVKDGDRYQTYSP